MTNSEIELRPYEPSKKELAEMDELRAQAEQELSERKELYLGQ
jgi:hypothetical protein